MRISRRTILAETAGLAVLAVAGPIRAARADDFPNKPLRLIVGFAPGGTTDFVARLIAEAMTAKLGQTVIVESKLGGNSVIAMDYVAKSPPDGYTLVFATEDSTSMLQAEKPNLPYDIARDFTYISRTVEFSYALAVNPNLPIKSVADLVAYARANPGKLHNGSAGVGSTGHIGGLQLEQAAGVQITHVPYRGSGPAMTDVISGVIDMTYQSLSTVLDQSKAGKLRLIAVTSEARKPLAPDVPTMAEAGYPSCALSDWFGVLGPAKLAPPAAARLGKALTDMMNDAAFREKLLKLDLQPAPLAGEAFRTQVVKELGEWKAVMQQAHLVIQ